MGKLAVAKRLFETVRYLTAEQWIFRFVCRGQRIWRQKFPDATGKSIKEAALALPLPDLDRESLATVTRYPQQLQLSVHGDFIDGVAQGRFTFLNRTVDFSSIDAVEWRRDLGEQNNPLWRMNLAYFGWSIPFLAKGGLAELDVVLSMVASLEQQNPFTAPSVFRDVWNTYTVSHRLINLLTALVAFRRTHGDQFDALARPLLEHVRFCAAFIRASLERDLQYNHLLKNYVALTVYATSLQDVPKNWRMLEASVKKSVSQQVLADGGQAERAPMYHLLSTLDLQILGQSRLFESWSVYRDQLVPQMMNALRVMCHPDGDIALFNDSWLGEGPPARDVLLNGAEHKGVRTLPETGYSQIRTDAATLILDHGLCGPDDNPGHAHADFLSLELSVGKQRFLVDPGVPTYSAGHLRNMSRSAAEHNGPALQGAEPIDFWASFRVGRRGRAGLLTAPALAGDAPYALSGWQSGYDEFGVRVGRWIGLWPEAGVLILDRWLGTSPHAATTKWLIHPDWTPGTPLGFTCGEAKVQAAILAGAAALGEAQCWLRFGKAEPCQSLQVTPEQLPDGHFSASWFGWGGDCPLGAEEIGSLRDRLAAALRDWQT